jgi:hypothetical protein
MKSESKSSGPHGFGGGWGISFGHVHAVLSSTKQSLSKAESTAWGLGLGNSVSSEPALAASVAFRPIWATSVSSAKGPELGGLVSFRQVLSTPESKAASSDSMSFDNPRMVP